jgi:hypothetical protein
MAGKLEFKSIKYAIIVQNVLFFLTGICILLLSLLMLLANPYTSQFSVIIFWITLGVLLSSILSYLQFWYFFSLKSQMIETKKINVILTSSLSYSAILVYAIILYLFKDLNYVNVGIVLLMLWSVRLFNQ